MWERRDSEAQSDEGLGMSQPLAVALCVRLWILAF